MQRNAAKSNATRAKSADVSQRSMHRSPVPAPPHRLPPLQKTPGVPQAASNHVNKPKSASRNAPSQLARSKPGTPKNASRAKSARSCNDQDSDSGYDEKMSNSSLEDDDDYLEIQAVEEWKAKCKVASDKSNSDLLTTFERQLLHFERRALVDSNGHRKRLSHSFADLKARLNHLPVIREEMSIHPQLVEY